MMIVISVKTKMNTCGAFVSMAAAIFDCVMSSWIPTAEKGALYDWYSESFNLKDTLNVLFAQVINYLDTLCIYISHEHGIIP